MTRRILVILSGGLDSATALAMKRKEYPDAHIDIFHVSYGQVTANKEKACALFLAEHYKCDKHILMDMSLPMQISDATALCDFDSLSHILDKNVNVLKPTEVVNRNGIILSYAIGLAKMNHYSQIVTGVNSVDYSGYGDCTPDYMLAMENVAQQYTGRIGLLYTPLQNKDKQQIVNRAIELEVPLAHTWSCYFNSTEACGVCDSCRLRLKGFLKCDFQDPIKYKDDFNIEVFKSYQKIRSIING